MNRQDLRILIDAAKRLRRERAERRRHGRYRLRMMILYGTMRCNARCRHCFLRDELNAGGAGMSIEQIDRLAETAPDFHHLSVTGGEPLLRDDLADALECFLKRDRIRQIDINTNGLLPERAADLAESLKRRWPGVGLSFQVSIDGLPETHDRIRGVAGGFDKAVETLRRLGELSRRLPFVQGHVLTVIMKDNYTELVALDDLLREKVGPELIHGFELARHVDHTAWGIPPEIKETAPEGGFETPPVEAFDRIAADLKRLHRRRRARADAFHVHNLAQLEMVRTGRPQFPCVTAGSAVAVVYADGSVAHCEFTKPFGRLDDFDFDFGALWDSEAAERRREQIRGCHCVHGCFHGTSVEYHGRGLWEMLKRSL